MGVERGEHDASLGGALATAVPVVFGLYLGILVSVLIKQCVGRLIGCRQLGREHEMRIAGEHGEAHSRTRSDVWDVELSRQTSSFGREEESGDAVRAAGLATLPNLPTLTAAPKLPGTSSRKPSRANGNGKKMSKQLRKQYYRQESEEEEGDESDCEEQQAEGEESARNPPLEGLAGARMGTGADLA